MVPIDKITAVQTSAGRGTRFRPLNLYSATSMIPKGLTRIMSIPLAELQIYQFKAANIREDYVITQFLENREHLSNRFGDGSKIGGIRIHYSDPADDKINNGSGDAILTNIIRKDLTGNSIALANDNIYEVDFEKIMNKHKNSGAMISIMTVLLRPRDTIGNYGLVNSDEKHQVTGLIEKPKDEAELMRALSVTNPDDLKDMRVPINTAGYILNNDALRGILKESWVMEGRDKTKGEFDMAGNLIKGLIERKYPVAMIPINAWGDFGSNTFFLDTFPDALSGKFPSIYTVLENQGYYHDPKRNIWVHPESLTRRDHNNRTLKERMDSGRVKIGPNVFIGREAVIGDGAEISYSDLEKYSRVEEEAQLNRVYLSPYCQIGANADLHECALGLQVIVESSKDKPTHIDGRSVIGPEIVVPSGSVLNNVRIFPGYSFNGPAKISKAKLEPSLEQVVDIIKLYR